MKLNIKRHVKGGLKMSENKYWISEKDLKTFEMILLDDYDRFLYLINNIKQQPLKPRKLVWEYDKQLDLHFAQIAEELYYIIEGITTLFLYRYVTHWGYDMGIFDIDTYSDVKTLEDTKNVAQQHYNLIWEGMHK